MKESDAMQTNQQSNFWEGKRVFVTGGTGFLGTHLTKKLQSLGAELSLFIHDKQSPLSALRFYGNLKYHSAALKPFLMGFNPEIVFHLASQPLVSRAMVDEVDTLETNIGGTFRVLHACKNADNLKSFVHISTDKVYGNVSPIQRDTTMQGFRHPYNASKLASDSLAQMYSNFFDVPMVIVRNANVYGQGDTHFDRIVPRTIQKVFKGESPVIRGDGLNTRDYIYIEDLVDGYIKAAELPYKNKLSILNLSGFNCSNLGVVDTILQKMGRVDLAPVFEKQWKGEIPHQHIVNDIAKELIDWNPKFNLSAGLDKTIPWYEVYLHGNS